MWDFLRETSLKANRKLDLKTSKRKEIGISALRIVKREENRLKNGRNIKHSAFSQHSSKLLHAKHM